jgi:hypothetical protein
MSDLHHPDPSQQLSHHAYYQLVHTLTSLLPPPLADTPAALQTRNQAAIAKVAALLPVNADEADLAAHCIAARAQAEDVLRLLRCHAGDIQIVMRLNAQFALMERTAVSIRNQLLRVQTARHKRDADGAAANTDEWTGHIAASRMQDALARTAPPAVLAEAPSMPAQSGEPPPAPEPASAPVAHPPLPLVLTALDAAPPPQAAAPPQGRRAPTVAQAEDPPRDLAAEVEYYANIYSDRARAIRQYGGLPPNCDFGPPDEELVHAIATGTTPALRALDTQAAA